MDCRSTSDTDGATSFVEDNTGKVQLSYMLSDGEQSKPTQLLRIPHDTLTTLSTKPRKWLCYAAFAICGVTGTLLSYSEDGEVGDVNSEGNVNPGDHFVYHLEAEPEFVDWKARDRTHSQPSISSQCTVVGLLREYYGGCPFTKVPGIYCQCCHLIPYVKKAEYLRAVLRARGDPDEDTDIDDPGNMIMLEPRLHTFFDCLKVAFLPTPNRFLKSNEIPGRETEDPEKYLITLHAFSQEVLPHVPHGVSSDMTEGSGKRQPPEDRHLDPGVLPNDTLLDIAYATSLLAQWGSKHLKPLLDENAKKYHIGEESEEDIRREEDRRNKWRERDSIKWERKDQIYELLLWMPYISRGISPEEVKEKREEDRRKVEQEEAGRIGLWRNDVNEESQGGTIEYVEEPCQDGVPDTDDEKPVRIEEALSRIHQEPFICSSSIPSLAPRAYTGASD